MADRMISGLFKPAPPFSVEDAYWGYIIRSNKGESLGFVVLQSVSFLLGAGALIAALGMIALSPLVFGAALTPFRLMAAVLLGAGAAYLLWFAHRHQRTRGPRGDPEPRRPAQHGRNL